jgi:phage terminase small subunit
MAGGTLEALTPPASLSPAAQEVFEVITPVLLDSKVLREDDIPMLEQCCEAWAMARYYRTRTWALIDQLDRASAQLDMLSGDELRDQLAEVEMFDGSLKRARAGWNQATILAARLSAELGLGPVARVRLGLARVQGQSLLEALMGDDAGKS